MSTAEQLKSEDAPKSRRGPVPFGNYLLDELIAVGGMARVYRARLRGALGFEKPLVVKQVRPELAADPRFVSMFAEEAKTLVRLTHPHIVTVYELGVVDETYFIAMEYIEGVTLQALIESNALNEDFVAHIASQVCDALHHAHERFDLVHRDVTPRNILIDEEGQTRLVDFGIAVPRDGDRSDEGGFGSIGYMSPEQLRGSALGPRSDVFSLGCAIHQALFGEVPFETSGSELLPRTDFSEGSFADHLESMISLAAAKRPNARGAGRVFRTWLSKNRPEGVAQELGALVSEVREEREAKLSPIDPDKTEEGHTSTTRSIATSPLLPTSGEILDAENAAENESPGTVPLPGRGGRKDDSRPENKPERKVAPPAPPAEALEEPPASRRPLFFVVLMLLAAAGLYVVFSNPVERSDPSATSAEETGNAAMENAATENAAVENAATENAATENVTMENVAVENVAMENVAMENVAMENVTMENVAVENVAVENVAMENVAMSTESAGLVIASTPWAEVFVDGERIGVTPLRERLPRGRHTIRLVNPALGSELRRSVNLNAGQTLRLRADFNSTPPAFR